MKILVTISVYTRASCSQTYSALFARPPDPPVKTERFFARSFPGAFGKRPAGLAAVAFDTTDLYEATALWGALICEGGPEAPGSR